MRVIALAVVLSLILTCIGYFLWGALDPASHLGAVFAGWVSGVALFCIVGVATAVVSIAKPEAESFDTRARILFKRQNGPHIDYIISRVKMLFEHYAHSATRVVAIRKYNEGEDKYRVSTKTSIQVRSFIDDIESIYASRLSCDKCTSPPNGEEPNRLFYVRIDGEPTIASSDFDETISVPIETTIAAGGSAILTSRMEIWVAAESEQNRYRPVRYTQEFTLEIENYLNRDVIIKFIEGPVGEHTIRAGQRKRIVQMSGLRPDEFVYDYRILSGVDRNSQSPIS